MIGYLTGKIKDKTPTKIILDVNGVGYLVNISISTFEKIAELDSVSLYTYLNVKEDALDLYGFFTLEEKEMFQLLISISGVGPKLAQSILSGIQIDELQEAISNANVGRITAIPGIGKKTAERLVVELKDKIESILFESPHIKSVSYNVKNDAVRALTNLGYNQKTAENAVRTVLESGKDQQIEEVLKEALAHLNR
ncbi:MAG: Holliday junction branch migration protein RuvA [Melioribacteraceae bacterium]|nr:Holliday junction branch migration protein RuvA [Melioribacteraceae bacterium]MCO6472556.1 Holliday junction branch migration protein RuvA [Melioribacteraceae bacterium]MDD3558341.1 Holliday junction branch migration protein RuvA [Melioribacteraceae bacterium]